jgi:hypothetical protein
MYEHNVELIGWTGTHDLGSAECASSMLLFAPALIFNLVNSAVNRVLCRKMACLIAPSPVWIPLASRRSCTSTKARFVEVRVRRSALIRPAEFIMDKRDFLSTSMSIVKHL